MLSSDASGKIVALIDIPIVDPTRAMHLELNFSSPTIVYDYTSQQTVTVEYGYTSEQITESANSFKKPIIKDFYPHAASIGDTVTMEGKYFTDAELMLFGRSNAGRSFFRPVHKNFVTVHTDEKIEFIIPPFMQIEYREQKEKFDRAAYIPVSKYIYLHKSGIRNSGTQTEEYLKIE